MSASISSKFWDFRYCEKWGFFETGNLLKKILGNRLAGLFWSINDQVSDTANNHVFRKLIWGEEKIIESINGLSFEVALDSFFQTNLYSAGKLYQKVLNYAGIKEKGLYLDLYCGTGTIAQILANECLECRVIGVDIEESAVEDARLNAKRNNLSNVEFFCEDVRIFLKNHSGRVTEVLRLVVSKKYAPPIEIHNLSFCIC